MAVPFLLFQKLYPSTFIRKLLFLLVYFFVRSWFLWACLGFSKLCSGIWMWLLPWDCKLFFGKKFHLYVNWSKLEIIALLYEFLVKSGQNFIQNNYRIWISDKTHGSMILTKMCQNGGEIFHLSIRYFEQCQLLRLPDAALAAWNSPVLQQSKECQAFCFIVEHLCNWNIQATKHPPVTEVGSITIFWCLYTTCSMAVNESRKLQSLGYDGTIFLDDKFLFVTDKPSFYKLLQRINTEPSSLDRIFTATFVITLQSRTIARCGWH